MKKYMVVPLAETIIVVNCPAIKDGQFYIMDKTPCSNCELDPECKKKKVLKDA